MTDEQIAMADDNGGKPALTPEQKNTAAQAAKDAIWHDKQIVRWSRAYEKANAASDFGEMTAIASLIDAHKARADKARDILKKLGFG